MATNNLPIANATTLRIRSLHDFQFKPEVIAELYKQYGDGFNTLDVLRSLGRANRMVSAETMTAEEEGYDIRTITLGSTVTVDNDNQLTFTLHADDVDDLGNFFPRVGYTVMFGDVITGLTQARLTSVTSDGGSPATITCIAQRYNTNSPTFTALSAASLLVANTTEIAIFDGAFAAETDQPAPTSLGTIQREFYSQILKESIGFGGVELAMQKWVSKQGIGLFNAELARAEFALDRQVEAAILFGQSNNRSLTQLSAVDGNANPIYKIKGLWTWIDELGGEVTYTGAGGWTFTDFDEMAEYFESQGVTQSVVMVLCGGSFERRVENSGVDYVKGTSGGLSTSNFFMQEGGMIMSGQPDTYLNVGFKGYKKGGNLFLLKTINQFVNPFQGGIAGYKLNDAAIAFPISMVKDGRTGSMIPNVNLYNVGLGGYNRGRIAGGIAGMDGFLQQQLNLPLISSVDAHNFYWLSHLLLTFMEANKSIKIRRSS